MKTIAHLVTLC